jgi:hypothetical protein
MSPLKNDLLAEILTFYVESLDHNGIPLTELSHRCAVDNAVMMKALIELVNTNLATIAFYEHCGNPHIKRLPDLPVPTQIQKLESGDLEGKNAYPSRVVLEDAINKESFEGRPFSLRLALGEAQLQPIFFDLYVLDRYLGDGRYRVKFHDYCGGISPQNQADPSIALREQDEVYLRTFGLGYDRNRKKVIVAYLRYLAEMTPSHQQIWNAQQVDESECDICPEYIANSINGRWAQSVSVYEAVLAELDVMNEMAALMSRPPLFRKTFNLPQNERPVEFMYLLRPTKKAYCEFAHVLDKMISENINHNFSQDDIELEREITRSDGKTVVERKGTITLLEEWLRKRFVLVDRSGFDTVVKTLRHVRKERQPSAHILIQNEYDVVFYEKQKTLIRDLYVALRHLRLVLALNPEASKCEVPRWLQDALIRSY